MKQANRGGLHSLLAKSLGLLAVLALTWFAGTAPVRAQSCLYAENVIILYWSDASHTTLVGECSTGPCPGAGCWGSKTSFISGRTSPICVICP
jgi:hypothetical protein